jgi:uncharacterized membrane protein
MMSQLIVLTFKDTEQAGQAMNALREAQHNGSLRIDDSAVIVKNESGKVEVKNQVDSGIKWGALGGSMLGLLLASVFFPLAGLAIGAIGGGLVGAAMNLGVDPKFVKEVTENLEPGTSALFVIGGDGDSDTISAVLRPFKGHVLQTTLDSEALQALKDALNDKEN